uniref:Uncharacterized protein n=1 Tax=Anguilla anguilla TaxID=7936 RepID=A0A0E9TPD1_ANGAN
MHKTARVCPYRRLKRGGGVARRSGTASVKYPRCTNRIWR